MTRTLACALLAALILSFALPGQRLPCNLRKAFEALEVYNYFAARQSFYKLLEKHPSPAAYGLSVIYSRNDNPFTNLDSAIHYAERAEIEWPAIPEKLLASYALIPLDSMRIVQQRERVDSMAFLRVSHNGSVAAYQRYIDQHRTGRYVQMAVLERNATAYELAVQSDSAAHYLAFMQQYPEADELPEALERYEERLYEEATSSKSLNAYRQFVCDHPESPYRQEAEYEVYKAMTASGSAVAFKEFINSNPDNPYTDKAWQRIYALEIGDNSPRSIAAFTIKYPDYPYLDELHSDFNLASTRYYSIRVGERWGYVDERGKVRITPKYDWTEPFTEALALVGMGDEALYIDKRGKELSKQRFDDGLPFAYGYAVVEVDGLQGIIDRLGQWIVKPGYDACGEFSGGFFYAEKDGDYGYLNRFGREAIPFTYSSAGDFVKGRAIVAREGAYAYIDTAGQALTAFIYEWLEPFQSHGVARYRRNGRFGLIAHSGDTITGPVYDALGEYHEGMYLAAQGENYGFIRKTGDTAIDFKYHFRQAALTQSYFVNGAARVYQKVKKDVLIGVIDTLDKKLVPAMFVDIGPYEGPLIAVRKKDLWGYADREVNLAIKYQYDDAGPFIDSTAIASLKGRYGLINTQGKAILPFQFSSMQRKDTVLLVADSLYGMYTLHGDTIIAQRFSEAEFMDDHVVRFTDKAAMISYFDYRTRQFIWREDAE